ncbi:hypothetical protein V6N13_076060 [Hibiscus sabdariffa]|uniref:Uncharacterized protein n=1 Tax=Hibiscus sabdariffa TaxID=183260 RepID=A0ABR2UDG7_9ROSI
MEKRKSHDCILDNGFQGEEAKFNMDIAEKEIWRKNESVFGVLTFVGFWTASGSAATDTAATLLGVKWLAG